MAVFKDKKLVLINFIPFKENKFPNEKMIFSPHSYDLGLLMLIQFPAKSMSVSYTKYFLAKSVWKLFMQSLMSYLPKVSAKGIFVFLIFPVS